MAAFARTNLITTVSETPYASVPAWFTNWEATGLIQFDDKNGDGLIQYTGPASSTPNELTIDRDIMVLANPEIARLPNWVVGLVAAGGLAAALSTAAGLLLVISSSVSHDLLKRVFRPQITEHGELLLARVAAGVAVIVAGYFGIHPPGFVAEVVAFAFGLAAASFFPAILLGIFTKRMNREGAISGMVAGLGFTAGYIGWFKFLHPELNTRGPLVVRDLARGDRDARHADQLRGGDAGGLADPAAPGGDPAAGGGDPGAAGCRPGARALGLRLSSARLSGAGWGPARSRGRCG